MAELSYEMLMKYTGFVNSGWPRTKNTILCSMISCKKGCQAQ